MLFLLAAISGSATSISDRTGNHWQQVEGKRSQTSCESPVQMFSSQISSSAIDLQLSESVSPARFRQDEGCIIPYASGYVAFWEDTRDGATAVYMQTLDASGNLTGSNQLFRALTNGDDLGEPHAFRDGAGKIHLFVRDQSHGLIYGARLASNLAVEVASYLVNDSSGGASAGLFDVDGYIDGRLVITWEDYSPSGNWIRSRSYSAAGVPGTIVQVSSVGTGTQQWAPSIAVDPSGGYLIVWEDYRNAQPDLYGRQFDAVGSPVGSDLTFVPGGPAASEQIVPEIAFSSVHDFVVGWIDGRAGQQLYAQRFDAITGLVGVNTLINAASSSATTDDPSIISLPNGTVVCGWASFAATNQILFTTMTAGFTPQTEFPIQNASNGQRWGVYLLPIDNSSLASVWTEVDIDEDIRAQRISTTGTRAWTEQQLNDDANGTIASDPAVAAFTTWNHLAVFSDRRNDGGDIFLQAFTSDGQLLFANRRVTEDAVGVTQTLPAIAARPNGGIITWRDDRSVSGISGQRIFGRLVDAAGLFTSSEFLISDTLSVNGKNQQTVAINDNLVSVAMWAEQIGNLTRLHGSWRNASGAPIAPVQLIDAINTGVVLAIGVGADSGASFHFGYLQVTGSGATVFGRSYSSGQMFQTGFSYALPGGSATQEAAFAFQPDGGTVITWTETQSGGLLLKVVGLNPSGVVRSGPVTVVSTASYRPRDLAISSDEFGRISLCWIDDRTFSPQAMATQLQGNLTTLIAEYAVAMAAPSFMKSPAVSTQFGRSHIVWADPRGAGLGMYGSTTLFDPTDADDEENPALPNSFAIHSVYPNPFNPSTTISFTLPTSGEVRLSIRNLLGQEVVVLKEGQMKAGEHEILWNAEDADQVQFASGVYFVVIEFAGKQDSRSVVLLK